MRSAGEYPRTTLTSIAPGIREILVTYSRKVGPVRLSRFALSWEQEVR